MDDDGLTDYEEVMIYGTKADQMDTDSDGLSDYQEVITYGTNPLDEDSDNDGLLDIEELNTWNTDPNSFDKDEDEDTFYHFQDCNDTNPNINPGSMESLNNIDDNCDNLIDEGFNETDIDNDGLFDWNEYHMYGTNFTNNDTDNDGLSDSYEIYISGTNPLIPDLDNDGDGWYWFEDCNDQESNIYPDMNEILDNIDNDCDESVDEDFVAIDTDLDGLTDYEEYHNYSTDPLDGDSDDDGLSEGLEVNSFDSDPLQTDLDRDHDGWYEFQDCDDNDFDRAPDKLEQLDNKDNDCDGIVDEDYWSLDSDYDGISDYSEYHNYTTDPHNDDSDSDGMTDSFEILVSFSDPNKYDYDNDYDGFYGFEDCNDLVFSINSGVVEIWNGMDDNCNNVVDENIERISIISSNPAFGEEYYWDSANKSLIITLEGVPGNIARTITWEFEGFSITENTSSDNSRLFLPPLDCNDIYRTDLATHLCLEGDKIQNITVTIEDLGVITELKWDVETDVWIRNSNQENSAISFISGTFGIIMIISFVIIVSAIGVAVGLRIENNKNLKDAYDAFGVSNMSKTSNQNIVLPGAPEIIDSEK
jgi:hypothetical protein